MSAALTGVDIERIADLQPPDWQDIQSFYRFYVEQPFCFPVKIEVNNQIAGIGCVIFNTDTCWLAHIIVSDRFRRQGLGKKITQQLIEIAEEQNISTQFLIATIMGQPLYEQLGFVESCRYIFHKVRPPLAPADATEIRQIVPADLDAVLALDRQATGEDRRGMISNFSRQGWVVDAPDNNGLVGFFLPGLGDGVVVAAEGTAGIDLLRLRLSAAGPKVVLPEGNTAALEFLAGQGLEVDSTAARMVRNGIDPLDHSMIFCRVGGHFG